MNTILTASNISKSYPGVQALDNVNFNVYEGKVNVLVGENGAGKSTLMKILAGVESPTTGIIKIKNKEVSFSSTNDAEENSIGIIHQELNLFPNLPVYENIFMGNEITYALNLVNKRQQIKVSLDLINKLKQNIRPEDILGSLRIGQQQIVEIAKALVKNTKILIMDEPSSALSKNEVAILFEVIDELKNQGVSIIYISHKLEEIMQIGDMITILRDSKLVCEEQISKIDIPWITEKMVGMKSFTSINSEKVNTGSHILKVDSINLKKKTGNDSLLDNVSFQVNSGEILSIYGLMGSGRTEILECIMGLNNDYDGKIYLENRILKKTSIAKRIGEGVVLVPEDRQVQGLVQSLSIFSNILLSKISGGVKEFILKQKKETEVVNTAVDYLGIKTKNANNLVTSLSGGNQQKVVFAKTLQTKPKLLMLDEPTRGIDIGAKQEIFYIMKKLAKEGLAIIFVSSEIKEVLAVSDRVIVLSKGKIVNDFDYESMSEDSLVSASQGKN